MNTIEFGKFIASLRNEKKLTQEELAEKLYIDKRKISRWECGMSIPDFDMLIKLSEILDVSLYELSICKRLDKEKISTKVINKFKGLKDFKKYQLKKKIIFILSIIIGLFFILTTIYTFKYYGTVEIYELHSLDEEYVLEGVLINTSDYDFQNINKLYYRKTNIPVLNDISHCEYEIYNKDVRTTISKLTNNDIYDNVYTELSEDIIKTNSETQHNSNLQLKITCNNTNSSPEEYNIKFELIKKYDNKLF